jgi:hypothetical protein
MSWNDSEYFRKRAAAERALAEAADQPRAAAIHAELAERYQALIEQGKRPALRLAAHTPKPEAARPTA